ncbi:uncharacterized protein [Cicer arietinum]|uniref:Early nodulin-75-like n=1 Tax=Cicer arietinum TaxID=3827 RepID=A0A1S2XJ93_CICAR|nr:early nodulin-75-like [Cicer arietinum]
MDPQHQELTSRPPKQPPTASPPPQQEESSSDSLLRSWFQEKFPGQELPSYLQPHIETVPPRRQWHEIVPKSKPLPWHKSPERLMLQKLFPHLDSLGMEQRPRNIIPKPRPRPRPRLGVQHEILSLILEPDSPPRPRLQHTIVFEQDSLRPQPRPKQEIVLAPVSHPRPRPQHAVILEEDSLSRQPRPDQELVLAPDKTPMWPPGRRIYLDIPPPPLPSESPSSLPMQIEQAQLPSNPPSKCSPQCWIFTFMFVLIFTGVVLFALVYVFRHHYLHIKS